MDALKQVTYLRHLCNKMCNNNTCGVCALCQNQAKYKLDIIILVTEPFLATNPDKIGREGAEKSDL
jgi:hypothetical protein